MKVELLNCTPLQVCAKAIRTCWDSHNKGDSTQENCGEADKALINRVGNQYKHSSTLEHITYNFFIAGISRACLQELARHRMASLSVKSSRYTLKELKEVANIDYSDFVVLTGNDLVDSAIKQAINNLQKALQNNVSNDIAKYCMPEAYKTELTWSINARSLQNFLELRSSKAALWEIRDLANCIYKTIPDEHKYLFETQMNATH